MSKVLRSVGLDVGTTSTQMVVSELEIENRASQFAVPELEIRDRRVVWRSPVYFTPLLDEHHMDGEGLRRLVEEAYAQAGITRADVDTGAVIVTGETSRKENARTVLNALSELAGDFVVAAAGPALESVLAAKGAGADRISGTQPVLHMDIGGGTANLALFREGKLLQTGCLNVGGRLVKVGEAGEILYISPVIQGIFSQKEGERISLPAAEALAEQLVRALEMAAGLRDRGPLLDRLWTRECETPWEIPGDRPVLSFSGGVADCIDRKHPDFAFGDIGPILGRKIRGSALCRGAYVLGRETIRATVIGAGCHAAQLSGSTVFYQNISFPLKNLPVAGLGEEGILAMPGVCSPSYRDIIAMAEEIVEKSGPGPVVVCVEQDMAKALGQALSARLPREKPILCLDRVRVGPGDYLDVGEPVGEAMPVVVKTLVMGQP
ncbi:MAG: ethanolamine ammonia-lyase reactivating factor EutA [Eubacteriales bacterium]|nr:ethanolamine ammonia-lyase reactivating factor EutA [Eubacteriales bacterium]